MKGSICSSCVIVARINGEVSHQYKCIDALDHRCTDKSCPHFFLHSLKECCIKENKVSTGEPEFRRITL